MCHIVNNTGQPLCHPRPLLNHDLIDEDCVEAGHLLAPKFSRGPGRRTQHLFHDSDLRRITMNLVAVTNEDGARKVHPNFGGNLYSHRWIDLATGAEGVGVIALFAYLRHVTPETAAHRIATFLALSRPRLADRQLDRYLKAEAA